MSTPAPARPHPAGLPAFTAALTSHLPGAWRTTFRYLLLPPGHDALDLLQAAVQRDATAADLVPHQATVLTGPGAERFLITDHPLWHETYLVRALIPDGILLGHDLLDDGTTALTMDLPGDPTAAAASLTSDFLPRYDAAAEPLRLRLLAAHLHAARALDEAWEAVAAAYFDDRGRPVADAEYHQAKALIRDEPGWTTSGRSSPTAPPCWPARTPPPGPWTRWRTPTGSAVWPPSPPRCATARNCGGYGWANERSSPIPTVVSPTSGVTTPVYASTPTPAGATSAPGSPTAPSSWRSPERQPNHGRPTLPAAPPAPRRRRPAPPPNRPSPAPGPRREHLPTARRPAPHRRSVRDEPRATAAPWPAQRGWCFTPPPRSWTRKPSP